MFLLGHYGCNKRHNETNTFHLDNIGRFLDQDFDNQILRIEIIEKYHSYINLIFKQYLKITKKNDTFFL